MKYKGRASLVSLSVMVSSFEYWIGLDKDKAEIEMDVIFTAIAWFVGHLYDKASFLSHHDFLTKTYNRRYLDHAFGHLVRKASFCKKPITVFVIDVNNFKKLNDTFGHELGDQVLKEIAGTMMYRKRKKDLVVRWGGDEFLVIAPNMTKEQAALFVKQIQSDIQTTAMRFKSRNVEVSVAVGKASFPQDGYQLEALLAVADANMYQAKETSKQRGPERVPLS